MKTPQDYYVTANSRTVAVYVVKAFSEEDAKRKVAAGEFYNQEQIFSEWYIDKVETDESA